MTSIIGIDLGTTNSLCTVFQDGQPVLIPNAHGSFLTPSVVGMLEDGNIVIGQPARELRITRPERCISTFKRLMGTGRKSTLGNHEYSAPELSSLVLQSLKSDAEIFLGEPVEDAVITVPAYFNDHQRKATKLAGQLAGLNVRRIVNEPTAAALTYGFHNRQADKKLIVIDLGGGTFDVTLMEIFEGTLEIVATAGESALGGEDFTDRLVSTVLKNLGLQLEVAEMKSPLLVARLRQQCEKAKCTFMTEDSATVSVPGEDGDLSGDRRKVTVTRKNFAAVSRSLMDRLKQPVARVLRDAACSPADIEDVILVGGATRMPLVRDFVRDFLKTEPLCEFNPDEVVALGAAVQAALIKDDAAVDDMVMTDVCPFTLGVETAREYGSRVMEGYYSPVIHRNTTIPVSKEECFSTMTANQREVTLSVYQGESRKVKDNVKLGELLIDDIPPGPAGQPIFVRFTYDLSGILEVEAIAGETGRKHRVVITSHNNSMTQTEIDDAVARMQELKFYPREDVENQNLLLYGERLIGEVNPQEREQLEQALQMFEHAMHSNDRDMFAHARSGLLLTLETLGFSYDGGSGHAEFKD